MTRIVLAAASSAFALLCVGLVVYTYAPGPVEDLDPGLAGISGLSGGISIPKPTLTPNQVKTLDKYEETRLKLLRVIRHLEGKLAGVSRPIVDLRVATVGSKGPPGPQGKKGVLGAPGIQGPMGKMGPMGPVGKQGGPGPIGAAGPAGPPGAPGRQGATGPKGPRGARGMRGDRGPTGPRGRPGRRGSRGRQGLMGQRGDRGPRGHRGARGATGPRGQIGAPPPAPGVIKGKIINVMNGRALTGVALRVKHHGRLVKNIAVDRRGKFRGRLSPGQYLLEGVARGFQHFRRTITIVSGASLRHRVFMSPTLASGEMRLVLTWNKRISDLDMHLSTPSGCKVGWTNKKCYSSAAKASLDVDDTNGEGPETITIKKLQSGTYKLWIHRYSSGNMLRSDATVRAFFPSGVMRVYRVGTDGNLNGNKWDVLTIDGASGNLYGPVMQGTAWVSVPGSPAVFTGLSTSQSGLNVWAAANGNVYRRRGVSFAKRMGLGWSQVPGATAFGVAASDLGVWVWNRAGQIFARSGVTPANPTGTGWVPVPKPSPTSNIRTMSYDGANGVATTVDGRIWWRAGITAAKPEGTRWFQVPGRMDWIGVYSNTMWATRNGRVYRRLNMARSPPTGSGWQRVPGLGRRVGVSNGSVWLTSRTGRCFYRKGIRGNNRGGASWGQLPSNSRRITQIAVGNGVVWGLDNNHSPVFRKGVAQSGQ